MSNGWLQVPLVDIADIARGGSPRPIKKYITSDPDGINWIKIGDAEIGGRYIRTTREKIHSSGIKKSRKVEPGDFLLSNSMSFGRPYIAKISGCIHDGWLVLKPDYSRLNQDYLYYALSSPDAFRQFDEMAAGSTVRNLNIGLVSRVTIPVPSLDEQKRIVAVLDQAFAALDRARSLTDKNLSDTHSLHSATIEQLFDEKANNWERGNVSELVGRVRTGPFGSLLHKSDYIEGGIPLINPANIIDGQITPNLSKTISYEAAERLNAYELKAGDLIIGRRGEMGRCAPVKPEMNGWICGTGCFVIRPHSQVSSDFVAHLLRRASMVKRLTSIATGTTMLNLNNKALARITVEMPRVDVQRYILEKIATLQYQTRQSANHYSRRLLHLDQLRQALLNRAFSGDLF